MLKTLVICAVSIPVVLVLMVASPPNAAAPAPTEPALSLTVDTGAMPASLEPDDDCVAVAEAIELAEPVALVDASSIQVESSEVDSSEPDMPVETLVRDRECDRCKLVMCHVPGRWTCHACGITLLDAAAANGQQGLLPQCPHETTR